MEIVKKILKDGEPFGFLLNSSGLEYLSTIRGLYVQEVISELINDGYKYYDYYGKIIDPNGININDYISEEHSGSMSEFELAKMDEDNALTEQQALNYFVADITTRETLEFLPLVNSIPTINTREELENYLDEVSTCIEFNLPMHHYPLNSFVRKEALYKIKELSNEECRKYMDIIAKRRKLLGYSEYIDILQFLIDNKALKEEEIDDYDAFLRAYNSWGVEGINCDVLNSKHEQGVNYLIYSSVSNHGINGKLGTDLHVRVKAVMNRKGEVTYKGIKLNEDTATNEANTLYCKSKDYYKVLRNFDDLPDDIEYQYVDAFYEELRNRYCYSVLDEDGITYEYRYDNIEYALVSNVRSIFTNSTFLMKMINNNTVHLCFVNTNDKYEQYNSAIVCIQELNRVCEVKTPYTNSFDIFNSEGLSPESVCKYLSRKSNESEFLQLHQVILGGLDYSDAYKIFNSGLPSDYLDVFNPDNLPYESIEELIDIVATQRGMMLSDGSLVISKKLNEVPPAMHSVIRYELNFHPIENIQFILNVLNKNISVCNFGAGKYVGRRMDDMYKINTLLSLYNQVRRSNQSLQPEQFMKNVLSGMYIDFEKEYPTSTAMYDGYVDDIYMLRKDIGKEASTFVWITKVYNEINNTHDYSSSRHYAFECATLSTEENSIGLKYLNIVSEALLNELDKLNIYSLELENIKEAVDFYAVRLMFYIMTNSVLYTVNNGYHNIEVKLPLYGKEAGDIKIIVNLSNEVFTTISNQSLIEYKYSTLYDWCKYEVRNNGTVNMYCINATINPWYVTAKESYGDIPVYNFFLNFIYDEAYNSLPVKFRERIASENSRPYCLRKMYYINSIIKYDIMSEFQNIENNYELLKAKAENINDDETMTEYFNRFTLINKETLTATDKKRFVGKVPLKSDYCCYPEYANAIGIEPLQDIEYTDSDLPKLKNSAIRYTKDSNKNYLLLEDNSTVNVKWFDFKELSMNELFNMQSLLDGTFRQSGVVVKKPYILEVCLLDGGVITYETNNITPEDLAEIANNQCGILITKNKLFVETQRGALIVEAIIC